LFLVFGTLLLWSAVRGEAAVPVAVEGKPAAVLASVTKPGLLSRAVMDAAARFEAAAAEDYRALAAAVSNAELKSLFATLMEEERRHLSRVQDLSREHAAIPSDSAQQASDRGAEDLPRFLWTDGEMLSKEMEILAAAIRQEKAKADFYAALAKSSVLPGLKASFQALAQEELEHMRRLQNAKC
jgi:rubrerythrin